MTYVENKAIPRVVKWWLVAGLALIFFQVVIGGITRLTGSGLSITKWEIVVGTLPPMGEKAWAEAFEAYQKTPQYAKINAGMPLADFQFIYFWEWFHRLWARSMGFVFVIPFVLFWAKGWFSRRLLRRLPIVVLLAATVGAFGWFMVWTGLQERPWVNAYALTGHLGLALLTFGYLAWTTFQVFSPAETVVLNPKLRSFSIWLTVVCCLQIALGGVMSGMKAGLFYPTWPTMRGEWLPSVLLAAENWKTANIVAYDTNAWMPALVQFLHRGTAYLLAALTGVFAFRALKINELRGSVYLLLSFLGLQILLGIWTLLSCVGRVPVALGSLHQACAVGLFTVFLWVNYRLRTRIF